MPSTAIVTVIRMLEELPEATQNRIVEHLQEYIEDLQDEARWESTLRRPKPSWLQQLGGLNEKLPMEKRSHWTTTSYEVKCPSFILGCVSIIG